LLAVVMARAQRKTIVKRLIRSRQRAQLPALPSM
jgi:hypothetical protein